MDKENLFEVLTDEQKDIFKEALKYLKGKVTLTKEEFDQLTDRCKSLAFTVTGYTELQVLEQFKTELEKAIENGTTKEQFRKDVNSFLEDKRLKGLLAYKADNIFRTNILTAFSVGHYKHMHEGAVLKSRPYWMYQTAGDGNVRDAHQAMDGKVFRADDPIWNEWYPPNGYKCRCTVVSLSPEDVKRRGKEIESDYPRILDMETGELKPVMPDKGFEHNPALQEFKPDLTGFSKSFKKIYEERNSTKP